MGISTVQICYNNGVSGGSVCSGAVSLTLVAEDAANVILWNTDPLTSAIFTVYGGTAAASFKFDNIDTSYGSQSSVRYSMSAQQLVMNPLTSLPFASGEVLMMYDNITTVIGNTTFLQLNGTANPGVWVDASNAEIRALDQTANSPQLTGQVYTFDLHVAFDDGGGAPLGGTTVTKPVTVISWANDAWVIFESFTGANGTNLTAHTPDVQIASPGGWSIIAGGFEIQSNGAEATGANSMAAHDTGLADIAWHGHCKSFDEDFALIGRIQDASNYWQFLVEDAGTSDPILKLNEVNAGTPTTRDSKTLTGRGPLGSTNPIYLYLVFSGNEILAQMAFRTTVAASSADPVHRLSYTSASFNSETRHGIQCASTAARWDQIQATAEPANWIAYL